MVNMYHSNFIHIPPHQCVYVIFSICSLLLYVFLYLIVIPKHRKIEESRHRLVLKILSVIIKDIVFFLRLISHDILPYPLRLIHSLIKHQLKHILLPHIPEVVVVFGSEVERSDEDGIYAYSKDR